MPRRLALELTPAAARALVATTSESRVTVEKSLTIPLTTDEEQAERPTVEQTVVEALSKSGIARLETIAVVGRGDIELRLLSVPPAPDEELPNLVRFQASQELPNLDADAPLDYLPLGEAPGQPRRVLAAVLKPDVKQRIERICREAKLSLGQIVLRSAASVSLMLQEKLKLRGTCCLLVEMLGRQVELAAVNQGRVVFLRHMLLSDSPADSTEAAESLFSEIRRTRVVVANQENVETVEPIVLVDDGPARRKLAERLDATTDGAVLLVDAVPRSLIADVPTTGSPEDRDHWRAMVGALADEAAQRPPAFDFLHPRQAPKPASRRNTYALVGLAAAIVVLAAIALNWHQRTRLEAEILRLENESAALEPKVQEGNKLIEAAEHVESRLKGEVVWIEELRWLSEQLPPAQDARLTKLIIVSDGPRRQMTLSGLARDVDAVTKLDQSLRDATHQIVGKTKSERGSKGKYQFEFGSSVRITPRQ